MVKTLIMSMRINFITKFALEILRNFIFVLIVNSISYEFLIDNVPLLRNTRNKNDEKKFPFIVNFT